MANKAADKRSLKTIIPLYIDLKGLPRTDGPIDGDLIENYVESTLRHGANRTISEILDAEYELGLQNGTWLVLFDSFDEIPDILASSRPEEITHEYSLAIHEFFAARQCGGVIASRAFHAPTGLSWPTWQILPLSRERQRQFVRRYALGSRTEKALLTDLATAESAVAQEATNPLFLGLLVEYFRQSRAFPTSAHDVYEAYISRRLDLENDAVTNEYGVSSSQIRATAERLAFRMTNEGLGLRPSRRAVLSVLAKEGCGPRKAVAACLDALVYLELASQGETDRSDPLARTFTFSHRRLQEYFATAAVLSGIGDVAADALLLDPRWQETAVALCQLQRGSLPVAQLVRRADELVFAALAAPQVADLERGTFDRTEAMVGHAQLAMPWPNGVREVLNILDRGFASDREFLSVVSPGLRERAGRLLEDVFWGGPAYDRATAVAVAGIAPPEIFDRIIREAFKSGSQLLADEAYRQLSRLRRLPEDLEAEIRRVLLRMCAEGDLRRDRLTVSAQLSRFEAKRSLLQAQRLTLAVPRMDVVSIVITASLLATWDQHFVNWPLGVFALCAGAAAHFALYGLAASLGGTNQGERIAGRGDSRIGVVLRSRLKGRGGPLPTLLLRVLLTYLVAISIRSADEWLLAVAVGAAMAWPPAALVAVRRGELLRFYPLALLSPLAAAWGLRHRKVTRVIAAPLAALAAGIAAVLALGRLPSSLTHALAFAFTVLVFSAVLAKSLQAGHAFFSDLSWYRHWQPDQLDAPDLMDALARVRTAGTATQVLVDVRLRGLLRPESRADDFLADLAHAAQTRTLWDGTREPWRTPRFDEWLDTVHFVRTHERHVFTGAFEDEVTRLVWARREGVLARDTPVSGRSRERRSQG